MLDICNNGDTLETLRIIKIFIQIIRIIVPLALIVMISKSIFNSVITGELKKELKNSGYKIIAALIIGFLPTIVNLILIVSGNADVYNSCVKNATKEGVQAAYSNGARSSISKLKQTYSQSDYDKVMSEVASIKDETVKNELLSELKDLKVYVDINTSLTSLENNFSYSLYDSVNKKINELDSGSAKEEFLQRFNKIEYYQKNDVNESEDGTKYHINGYNGLKYYLYSQCEGNWKNRALGKGTTFCDIGCGCTTQTVIITSYNSSVTPANSFSFCDDYHHDEVIEKETNNNYDCTKYDNGTISNDEIINNLKKGNVASILVYGRSKGGQSKFTTSQHFMALIDYIDGEIFVGNAYNMAYNYGKYGWYNADEVLTSVTSTVICKPINELAHR